SALGFGLRRGGCLFIGDLALAFDADALQPDAGHLSPRRELTFDFSRLERIAQFSISTIGMTLGVHIRPNDSGIVPAIAPLPVIHPAAFLIRPGSNAAAAFAAFGIEARFIALSPALAGADAHRR